MRSVNWLQVKFELLRVMMYLLPSCLDFFLSAQAYEHVLVKTDKHNI